MILLLGPKEQVRAKVRDLNRDGLKDHEAVLIEVCLQVIVEDAELVLLNCHHATKPPVRVFVIHLTLYIYYTTIRLGLSRVSFWEKNGADVAQIFTTAFYDVYGPLLERRPPASSKFWDKKFGLSQAFFASAFLVVYGALLERWPLATTKIISHLARFVKYKNKKNFA